MNPKQPARNDEWPQDDWWEASLAIFSLTLGGATSFLSVYPVLHDVPGFSREGLTLAFGLLLSAVNFVMGIPCLNALRRATKWMKRKMNDRRKANPEES